MPHEAPQKRANARLAQRWQKADFDQRRDLIIDAALALLDRHGREAVTVRRVAARLGVGAMTLYTYLKGQPELHREMVRRGFAMLQSHCVQSSTLDTSADWRGGARAYVQFALENPNLYKLMFDTPMPSDDDSELLKTGFQSLLDKVRTRLAAKGVQGEDLHHQALAAAGRYWIALHGLTTLAISGRLSVLESELDPILDDLLTRVAPT